MSALNICSRGDVSFTDQSSNYPDSWSWHVAGAISSDSTLSTPTYSFPVGGIYTISLVAANSNGNSTATKTLNVLPSPTVSASSSHTFYCPRSNFEIVAIGANTYTWNTGEITAVINKIEKGGEYIFVVTGSALNGCRDTDSILIRVSVDCFALSEEKISDNTLVIPNPAENITMIQVANSKILEVKVYDFKTELVLHTKFNDGLSQVELGIAGLPQGLYFLEVITDDGVAVKKLFKL